MVSGQVDPRWLIREREQLLDIHRIPDGKFHGRRRHRCAPVPQHQVASGGVKDRGGDLSVLAGCGRHLPSQERVAATPDRDERVRSRDQFPAYSTVRVQPAQLERRDRHAIRRAATEGGQ